MKESNDSNIHIVYICSPDRAIQLLISLGSLITSGTQFDRITIYCIGGTTSYFSFEDHRITVKYSPDISKYIWMENKTYLSEVEGGNVIFIDTDTIVMKPLELLCEDLSQDIAGRLTTSSSRSDWNPVLWQDYLRKYGAKEFFPYLNTGLLVFNNGSHKSLDHVWLAITRELLSLSKYPFGNRQKANQIAFSLACGSLGISYQLLSLSQHSYGWTKENYDNTLVFHTGNKRFISYLFEIDKKTKLLDNNPWISRFKIEKKLQKQYGNSICNNYGWTSW